MQVTQQPCKYQQRQVRQSQRKEFAATVWPTTVSLPASQKDVGLRSAKRFQLRYGNCFGVADRSERTVVTPAKAISGDLADIVIQKFSGTPCANLEDGASVSLPLILTSMKVMVT